LKTSRAVVSRAGRGRRGSAAEVGIELGNRGVEEIDVGWDGLGPISPLTWWVSFGMRPKPSSTYRSAQGWWNSIWADTTTRRTILFCALVGIALFVFGIWLDVRGNWSSLPFVTNLASSLTGASFGIIFALLILQYVTHMQAEAQGRREAERLYRRGLAELQLAAQAVVSGPSGSDLARPTAEDLKKIEQNLPSLKRPIELQNAPPPDEHALVRQLPELLDTIRESTFEMIKRVHGIDRRDESWANLQAQWRFFSDFVRGRVFSADVPWLCSDDFYRLQIAFGFPVDSPWKVVLNTAFTATRYVREAKSANGGSLDDDRFKRGVKTVVTDLRSEISTCQRRLGDFTDALKVLDRNMQHISDRPNSNHANYTSP
jgi:hypothetical protein